MTSYAYPPAPALDDRWVRRHRAALAAGTVLALGACSLLAVAEPAAAAPAATTVVAPSDTGEPPLDGASGVTQVEIDLAPHVLQDAADAATPQGDEPAPDAEVSPSPSLTPSPTPSASSAPGAVDAATTPEVTADDVDGDVVTPVIESLGTSMVGMTWTQGATIAEAVPQVRVRTDDEWSGWMTLEAADDGPDAGTADAVNAVRAGAEPIWVGDADAVQVRLDGDVSATPEGLRLELVDAGDDDGTARAQNAVYRTGESAAVVNAASSAPRPVMVSRAEWGADESLRTYNAGCGTPEYSSTLVAAVVHHTATGNAYGSPADARAVMRSMYAYHVKSRGWCDIGYNFVVDRWGYIYEGRAGGVDRAVKGVHTGGFNTNTVGVSMLGTFDSIGPSTEQRSAVASVIAWRLGAYGRSPAGTVSYTTGGGENSRFAAGTTVTLPTIFAHRDTAYTACPGNSGYATLPEIRSRAQQLVSFEPLIRALYADLLGRGPDPSGLATWSGQLAAGVSQSQLVATLTRSEEYVDRRIRQAYRTILNRAPDAPGMQHWRNLVHAGYVPVDDVARHLMSSDELYAMGGGNDQGYITVMYRQVLGRTASAEERAYWARQIPAGGRAVALNGIWISRESSQRRAAVYYRTFLGREPDPTGLTTWTDILMQQGEGAVRTGIAGSEEYLQRALGRF